MTGLYTSRQQRCLNVADRWGRQERWRRQPAVVYIGMTTHARDVVEEYYRAFDLHTDGWQDLVSDDVVFDGPVQHARGKAEFVALAEQFLQAHRNTQVVGVPVVMAAKTTDMAWDA